MFELNLIHKRLQSQKKFYFFLRFVLVFYAALVLIFALLIGKYLTGKMQIAAAESRISAYRKDIEQKNSEYGIETLRQTWDKTLHDMLVVDGVVKNRHRQAERIKELSVLLPMGICFNQANISPNEIILNIVIAPVGRQEYEILNEYIGRLEESPFFTKGVKIVSREKREFRGERAEYYQINVPVRQQQ